MRATLLLATILITASTTRAVDPAAAVTPADDTKSEEILRQKEFDRMHRLPIPSDGYTWQKEAASRKLDGTTIAILARDKIAYGATVKQSFTPYLGGPVFITTDSVLNAYHILFEDSFCDFERRQVPLLRKNLETVFRQAADNLNKSPFSRQDVEPAWRQVQYALGPALCLLGSPIGMFDADARNEIRSQVAKIRAASAVELPTWLAPAEDRCAAIDYRACKPVGFYANDQILSDYFRAVRWLQLVPFRANRDTELAAIGMLGYGLNQAYESGADRYFTAYASMLGAADGLGLPDAANEFQNFFAADKGATWSDATADKKRWLLRNVMPEAAWEGVLKGPLPSNTSTLLAPLRFHIVPAYTTRDTALFQKLADEQIEPEGLAVAMDLGSTFAREHLSRVTPQQVTAAATLLDQQAAARKDQTPHLPSLYDDYLEVLRTLSEPAPIDAPAFMRSVAWQAKSTQTQLSGWVQLRHTFTLQAQQSELYLGMFIAPPGFVEPNPDFFSRMADLVERSRDMLQTNRERWDILASVTRRLEAISYKQLRQQPWSHSEEKFILAYGENMGRVMGYDGNSYEVPNDDAPRWAEVHRNDITQQSLAVAVGRPRIIYVLYPWNGMEILCVGSVMPYYEYHTKVRLTDGEWKSLLDSPDAPPQPDWLRPYIGQQTSTAATGARGPSRATEHP